MIKSNQIATELVNAIQSAISCTVIKANQHSPIPRYPYVTFSVSSPMVANGGTWGSYEDGALRKPFKQVWSFTVQSDNDSQAMDIAMALYEFFDRANEGLTDKGIVPVSLSNISNRDNFITIQYEHRYGFDVTFAFMRENSKVIPAPELVDTQIEFEQ